MATSRKISARRHAVRTFGLFVLGGILASMGGGAPQVAAAEEVPAFAPGMIKHMQQMRRFKDVDKGPQPTPPVIPRFAAEPDPTGAVATFQPKGADVHLQQRVFQGPRNSMGELASPAISRKMAGASAQLTLQNVSRRAPAPIRSSAWWMAPRVRTRMFRRSRPSNRPTNC